MGGDARYPTRAMTRTYTPYEEAHLLIQKAVLALEEAGWKEEARDLDRDRRWSTTTADILLVRDDAEDFLARLEANA